MLGPRIITLTPTIDTAIYASGDAIGGLLTFPIAAGPGAESGRIISASLIDLDKQSAPIDLFLFDRSFTPSANNAVWAPSNADFANCIGFVRWVAGDYANADTKGTAMVRALFQGYQLASGGLNLFGQMVVRATPTFTGTANLSVRLCLQTFA
jgi:hypothetical protein